MLKYGIILVIKIKGEKYMPGFFIHIAIGKEYIRKHNSPENYDDFILGNISPDLVKDKSKSHYGKSPAYTSLKEFLKHNKIDNSLDRGRFMHLITDYLVYNHYLDYFEKEILHNDYDLTNKFIMQKYNTPILDDVKEYISFKEGEPEILKIDLITKIIDEISSLDIDEVEKEVNEGNERWEKYKKIV